MTDAAEIEKPTETPVDQVLIAPPYDGQAFKTRSQWVNKASSWLTRHPEYNNTEHGDEKGWRGTHFTAMCFDTKGRRCLCGADFQRAESEGAFPVWWVWPDQIADLVSERADLLKAVEMFEKLGWLKDHSCMDAEGREAAKAMRAALAKARGGAE